MYSFNDLIHNIFQNFDPDIKLNKIISYNSGLYNNVYKITINPNNKYDLNTFILRIAPPDDVPKLFYEKNMMRSEPGIHKLILKNTDIPVPRIFYHDFSKKIINSDYLIMEFLEGQSGFFSEEELGKIVKKLHCIKADIYGYPERELVKFNTWKETMINYAQMIFNDCLYAGAINKTEYDWFIEKYYKQKNLFKNTETSFLHLDLWSANILTINNKITGILDMDRGMFGDPELEFAVLDTYGFATDAFFKGYGIKRPKDPESIIRQKLYIVYELIKYAFIRLARGKSSYISRSHVEQCKKILSDI
ncbi:MAG: aminoglycoside phosphotransferase family protein [Spirochaetes bacterium]|nr:aminoglycoside phosphotransferase family protein [Spirochaetota bacterium]